MSIEIIDKLKPKNGQSFKLMDAEDVAYDETISVKEAIRTLGNANIFYLQDKMFAFTNITSVTSNFLHGEGKNAKLQYVGGLFYNCTNITGACPPFYDGSIFTKLITDSKGYYGCLYGCTGLSNYSTAQAISNNYVANQGWASY